MYILYLIIGSVCLAAAKAHHTETHSHDIYLIIVTTACHFMAGCNLLADAVNQRKDRQ